MYAHVFSVRCLKEVLQTFSIKNVKLYNCIKSNFVVNMLRLMAMFSLKALIIAVVKKNSGFFQRN